MTTASCQHLLRSALTGFACLSTVACTTQIKVAQLDHKDSDGLVYYLPAVRYQAEVTREVTQCVGERSYSAPQMAQFIAAPPPLVGLKIDAEINEQFIADAGQGYVWDYPTLDSRTKITDIDVALYPNGTIQSLNAAVDDRSGEIAINVLKGTLQLAAAFKGIPLGAVPGAQTAGAEAAVGRLALTKLPAYCTEATLIALSAAEAASGKIEALDEEAREIRTGEAVPDACKGQTGEEMQACLATRLEQISVQRALSEAALAKQKAALTDKRSFTLIPHFHECVKDAAGALSCRLALSWSAPLPFDPVGHGWVDHHDFQSVGVADRDQIASIYAAQLYRFDVAVEAKLFDSLSRASVTAQLTAGDGLVYRQPVDARLTLRAATGVLIDKVVQMPQAGILARLPLVNGPMNDNALTAEFAPSGALVKLGFDSQAGAAAASEHFLEAATTLQAFKEARRNKPVADVERETALVEAETKLLEAKQKRKQAENALSAQ